MANKLIILSGKQFSGKDTVAKILLEQLEGFRRIGLGDAIKIELGKQKGLTFDQIENDKATYRPELIELGNWGRAQDPDYWLNAIINSDGNIIVPDIRVEHEYNKFKQNGAFAIRVESSEEERAKRGTIVSGNDNTETALDKIEGWDYVIENDSTYDALLTNVDDLIQKINKFFA